MQRYQGTRVSIVPCLAILYLSSQQRSLLNYVAILANRFRDQTFTYAFGYDIATLTQSAIEGEICWSQSTKMVCLLLPRQANPETQVSHPPVGSDDNAPNLIPGRDSSWLYYSCRTLPSQGQAGRFSPQRAEQVAPAPSAELVADAFVVYSVCCKPSLLLHKPSSEQSFNRNLFFFFSPNCACRKPTMNGGDAMSLSYAHMPVLFRLHNYFHPPTDAEETESGRWSAREKKSRQL